MNGREQGLAVVYEHENAADAKRVVIAEARRSDHIVVYYGSAYNLSGRVDFDDNIPSDETYKERALYFDRREYFQAACYAYQMLTGVRI